MYGLESNSTRLTACTSRSTYLAMNVYLGRLLARPSMQVDGSIRGSETDNQRTTISSATSKYTVKNEKCFERKFFKQILAIGLLATERGIVIMYSRKSVVFI